MRERVLGTVRGGDVPFDIDLDHAEVRLLLVVLLGEDLQLCLQDRDLLRDARSFRLKGRNRIRGTRGRRQDERCDAAEDETCAHDERASTKTVIGSATIRASEGLAWLCTGRGKTTVQGHGGGTVVVGWPGRKRLWSRIRDNSRPATVRSGGDTTKGGVSC